MRNRVKSGKWEYVKWEIERINEAIVDAGAISKVIFENDCTYPEFFLHHFRSD
jgi:deoxyribose-phosphate aldolase